ncbi:MAG TPA: SDR family oxidoreductase [Candidatus Cloacimonadota bacterium]|nr:SDR family oxidoreductase [Candidatus Cloacimonadota bacterium]
MKLPKNIVITGANGQSASNLAAELLHQGCNLILLVHDKTDRIQTLLAQFGNQCKLGKCDLSNFDATSELLTNLIKETDWQPEGLVHTAAVRSYDAKALSESDPALWQEIFFLNISMAYNILRCVLPGMIERNLGKIVLFGSNVTRTGLPFGSAYAAAKSALANLTRSVAWETAAENIQINILSPAPIETDLESDYSGEYLKFRQEYFEAYRQSHPAHKLVSLQDVTQAALSLLNLECNSLSGEEIYLTGGVL